MALTQKQVEHAKSKGKIYKINDTNGLCLRVNKYGHKVYVVRYSWHGKNRDKYIGTVNKWTLKAARHERNRINEWIQECRKTGVEPYPKKRTLNRHDGIPTFAEHAETWLEQNRGSWAEQTYKDAKGLLSNHARSLSSIPGNQITTDDVLGVLEVFKGSDPKQARLSTRDDLHSVIRRVLSSAKIRSSYNMMSNPADFSRDDAGLQKAVGRHKPKNYRMLAPEAEDAWDCLPKFWSDITTVNSELVAYYVKLLILTLARPTEMRGAVWNEFDFKKRMWRVPEARMKKDRVHLVPLSDQAITLLLQLRKITGGCEHLFPKIVPKQKKSGATIFDDSKTMSENTASDQIKKLGYDCHLHGFRHMASSFLNEQVEGEQHEERKRWDRQWIEMALAHFIKNEVEETYNKAKYVKSRTKMLQWYADQIYAHPEVMEAENVRYKKVVNLR